MRTGPSVLEVRFETKPGRDRTATWNRIAASLSCLLASQGLAEVRIEQGIEPLERHPRSGKFRHVWTADA